MSKSCYVLELSVPPGRASRGGTQAASGARRADLFTYNRLVHLRRCAEQVFLAPSPAERAYDAALALSYGETIVLWVVEGGRLVRGIDLRRHIRVGLDGEPALLLSAVEADDAALHQRLSAASSIAFDIDWDAIAADTPALHGEPLRPGERLTVEVDEDVVSPFDSYLEIAEELRYGYEDWEAGAVAPPGFVDPDPGWGPTYTTPPRR